MNLRTGCLGLLSLLWLTPAVAAPSVQVRVDARGRLRIPVKTLRQLGIKPDRLGAVWVEFPAPRKAAPKTSPHAEHEHEHEHSERLPPRVMVTVGKEVIAVPRIRIDRNEWVPGNPGTRYLATGHGSELKLRRL